MRPNCRSFLRVLRALRVLRVLRLLPIELICAKAVALWILECCEPAMFPLWHLAQDCGAAKSMDFLLDLERTCQ